MPELNFTVDARLLQELGERLVGKPSVALAELVKNAYDADAHMVEIGFYPEDSKIVVRDDGHGMKLEDFNNFWMRVGTTHKAEKRVSPYLRRQMTGSKGVGRFAVQSLAKVLTIHTVTMKVDGKHSWIEASVNWQKAVSAGDLTSATVWYDVRHDGLPFEHGTELVLSDLRHDWTVDDLKELAREIWWLQPPFQKPSDNLPEKERFEIRFVGGEAYLKEFQEQLDAVMQIQTARLVGHCKDGGVNLAIEFWSRGTPYEAHRYSYKVADLPHNGGKYDPEENLHEAEFAIRIYKLRSRQPMGISLKDLKSYMEKFAGVHVYDGGFRLPFYGDPLNDWLKVEYDHSHREFTSKLLPKEIQVRYQKTERLRYLPTLRGVIGVVRVSTAKEVDLKIAITRDRLIASKAHEDLVAVIRYAFDQYAYDEAMRAYLDSQKDRKTEQAFRIIEQIEDVLGDYRDQIPTEIYLPLQEGIHNAAEAVKTEQTAMLAQLSLLGPLATAGVSAIAIQHELRKQFAWLEDSISRLRALVLRDETIAGPVTEIANNLGEWLQRARSTNALFDYMTADTIRQRDRYNAKVVVKQVLEQTRFLARGVEIDLDALEAEMFLPEASFAEWGAIFQNVFSNAFNAMLDAPERRMKVSTKISGQERILRVQDTGRGVDLEKAEDLFEPFVRTMETDQERMRLGYGGTGLGLTIVRLLTERIGCLARFVEPETGFRTAFTLEWKEKKAQR